MEENNYVQPVGGAPEEPMLVIDQEIRLFLTETVKWGKFLAILGFIAAAFLGLLGIGFMFFGSAFKSQLPEEFAFGGLIGFIYLLFGVLYYFPSKYLYDFSIYTRQALSIHDQESLVYAFSRLKSFYKFWGILTLLMIIFYIVAIVVGIIAGIAGIMA
ncbi:hypothetical protein G5B30_10955 [Sphingobacterium sp. SGG-5]|uniref:hypothetical protein n=1 Tax=Sphingobacterium sp. SGG-5 TaxID=2710881 RepID=UPI0013EA6E5F|nr:hypothetical protein [Sphingobacterium sp. SGG-5]NGM62430.1 hypothetical protein [Sphingobacterium sp. SGG-5]